MSLKGTSTTFSTGVQSRSWWLVDVKGKVVGRVASRIAGLLMGKDKAARAANEDAGDHVVVVGAKEVVFSGDKERTKLYYRHSQRPGGLKSTTPQRLRVSRPEEIIRSAVRGMLPGNVLRKSRLARLKIYAGAEHPHEGQSPVEVGW
ncbi:50S ribosomal protein L13 [bacterium]|nr:50S ribosomal protein L13 [bacterium]